MSRFNHKEDLFTLHARLTADIYGELQLAAYKIHSKFSALVFYLQKK